jgi:hypothetical protein
VSFKAWGPRAGIILLVLTLSSACFLFGWMQPVSGSLYTGIRSLNASDYNYNFSVIGESRKGDFFLRNLFTSEKQEGHLTRPVYYLLTIPFRNSQLPNSVVFHILRLFCGFLLLVSLFPLLRIYISKDNIVLLSWAILCFSSGIGIFSRFLIHNPADITIPESIFFLALGDAPHFLSSLLFLWLGLAAVYQGIRGKTAWLTVYLLCLCVLWWDHPFDAVILGGITVGALWLLPDTGKRLIVLISSAAISVPPVLYYLNLRSLQAYAGWSSEQNLMLSPSVLSLLSAFLPLMLIGVPGSIFLWRQPEQRKLFYFLMIWLIAQLILVYLPFPFQRRLIAGYQFPLAILAAYGLSRIRKPIALTILVLLVSTNVFVTFQQIQDIKSKGMPYYLPLEYKEAFEWLAKQDGGSVLSAFVTGNFIPAYTGLQSYMGHSSFTPDVRNKRKRASEFYKNPSLDFLTRSNIGFVFWGTEERRISTPVSRDFLEKVFENRRILIFKTPSPGER